MPQPEYVPLSGTDRVRAAERLPAPQQWLADRPADFPESHAGEKHFGVTGPDQGYGLKLARMFSGKLQLADGEHELDAVVGALGVGLKRASLFGRAPVIYDFDLAFTLWGFLGDAPADLVAYRHPLFAGAGHQYWQQRAIVDRVPEATLRFSPADVRARLANWRDLLVVD